jgi:hypothetical protein
MPSSVTAVDLVRTVKVDNAAHPKYAPSTRHQAFTDCPRRNVDHLDTHQRIGAFNGPLLRRCIKTYWRKQVWGICGRPVSGDACKRTGIEIAELRPWRQ